MAIDGHQHANERLWTPWRMNYVGGGAKETGCIFCNRLEQSCDIESLILLRGSHSFVIMNLYPYNTGHIMLVPNQHASDPAQLAPEALAEMGMLLPTLTNALRRAFSCHGFNVGLNIGSVAGAGVEAHLHEHIVPRWVGDANFMPILASTMTIPELIPVTYAKIRAELTRELTGATTARVIILDQARNRVLLLGGAIPTIDLQENEPIISTIAKYMATSGTRPQLAGWAGPEHADAPASGDIVLTFIADLDANLPDGWRSVAYDDAINDESRPLVEQAIRQLAPAIHHT